MQERILAGYTDVKRRREAFHVYRIEYFERFDALLDCSSRGPRWLGEPSVAKIVVEALHFRDCKDYDLLTYCVMPNHVHLVCTVQRNDIPLYKILQSLKRHTGRQSNQFLNREGAFWHAESYDHVIRNGEELERTLWYVLFNPVKAGLVHSWEDWQWTYCKEGLLW